LREPESEEMVVLERNEGLGASSPPNTGNVEKRGQNSPQERPLDFRVDCRLNEQ